MRNNLCHSRLFYQRFIVCKILPKREDKNSLFGILKADKGEGKRSQKGQKRRI